MIIHCCVPISLSGLGLTSKFRDTLQFAFERGVDAFFEPCLDIVNSSLYSASEAIREQPSLRVISSFERILNVSMSSNLFSLFSLCFCRTESLLSTRVFVI